MALQGIYLAGPDVSFPTRSIVLGAKKSLCAHYGFLGLPPLERRDYRQERPDLQENFCAKNLALMRQADLIIANLDAVSRHSARIRHRVRLGWFDGAGKPAYGYSNVSSNLETRVAAAFAPGDGGIGGAQNRQRWHVDRGLWSRQTI